MTPDPVTVWTARALVAVWFAAVLARVGMPAGERRETAFRLLWSLGLVVAMLHVGAAFHRVHGWSHAAAWNHTAEQTGRVTGVDWGGGLVANYLFLAWWTADVVARWRRGELPRGYDAALHAAFAFLMFNATAVFGPPFWKWWAAGAALATCCAWARQRMTERTGPQSPDGSAA